MPACPITPSIEADGASDRKGGGKGSACEEGARAELERYFFLDDADRGKVQAKCLAHKRLGARRAAEDADRAAYADAVSGYAALGRDGLREVARSLMAVTSGRG
ncbi:hypothetical protein ACFRQM_10170 [Streptomyces sp. NPDC056831]|uniref:hypothetical protein n=1 Tax=Streptomyces sp. NPDC056831 TaxID=3345954 RepID=UPI003684A317